MAPEIVFYRLGQKIVNNRENIPEGARQVMYYSLAIGHHVGVMDCFTPILRMPTADYARWMGRLPEGPGRRKLEGVLKWGEIEINCSHVGEIQRVLEAVMPEMTDLETRWTHTLLEWLIKMAQEPVLYLMVRKTV